MSVKHWKIEDRIQLDVVASPHNNYVAVTDISPTLQFKDKLAAVAKAVEASVRGVTRQSAYPKYTMYVRDENKLNVVTAALLRELLVLGLISNLDTARARVDLGLSPPAVEAGSFLTQQQGFSARNTVWCMANKDKLLAAGMTEEQYNQVAVASTLNTVLEFYYDNPKLDGIRIAKEHVRHAKKWGLEKEMVRK